MRPRLRIVRLVALLVLAAATLGAQKKPITQDTYDTWMTISGATLAPNGQWLAYTHSPVIGNGDVVLRATRAATERRYPRGNTGRPQLMPKADSTAQFIVPAPQFSADSRWLAFLSYPPQHVVDSARRAGSGRGGRGGTPPRNALTLVSTADAQATVIPGVRSFRLSRDGGRHIAYLLEPPAEAAGGRGAAPAVAGAPAPERGSTLVVRDLVNGTDTRIEHVLAYLFDEGEQWLAYTVAAPDSAQNGAYVRALADGSTRTLAAGPGSYKLLTLDRKGTQAAFVSNRGETTDRANRYSLYYAALARGRTDEARRVVSAGTVGAGVLVADRGRVDFVREGTALQFALAPALAPAIPADSLVEKAVYDLWHWNDTKIQPQQRIDAPRDRNRTWAAVYLPGSNRWTRIGNDSLTQVIIADNGRVALALNPVEYAVEQTWGEGGSDAYLVDVGTGSRSRIAQHLEFNAQVSPASKYVTFWEGGKWWAVSTSNQRRVEISAGIKDVRLDNELFDQPDTPPAYGLGGWTTDDRSVLIYDRYDVWEVDPSGSAPPRNLTAGAGRERHIAYRVFTVDPDNRALDPSQPLLLRGFNEDDKSSGFFRARLGGSAAPEQIVYGPRSYGAVQKARQAEQYLYTQQTYREFPDLWTGPSLATVTKVSNANPQEREYPRGEVELVAWRNTDGVPLQGLLYKPEGFDPSKKYPMIVYYYERLSDGLHSYVAPSGRNISNPLVYTSLGYLVFHPDIVYTEGYPGPSAVKAIIPGVQSLIQRGFVDPDRLGINGQSWGGYQSAFLVTQSNLFKAAVPNAPVVNMTSAYGGIRWGPGILRQFQYEHTQSRIGGSLWEYPERYIENSPLFMLDRVKTPVLFMHNDEDDAVPWYQGIEFFSAMRRLRKEAYMVVYNGDAHNPSKRANQKDIDLKMQQFFANKLLGAPAPDWMKNGISFLDKGRDQVKTTVP